MHVRLEELLVADRFGCEREVIMWGWPFLFVFYDSYRWFKDAVYTVWVLSRVVCFWSCSSSQKK